MITVGVLVVAFTRPSRPETTAVIHATLPGLAVALNNALNHEDLQRVAALDPLTGVYNRRFGLQRMDEEFGRSLRSGDPLDCSCSTWTTSSRSTTPTATSSATGSCRLSSASPDRSYAKAMCSCGTAERSSSSSCPAPDQSTWHRWPNASGEPSARQRSARRASRSPSPSASAEPDCPATQSRTPPSSSASPTPPSTPPKESGRDRCIIA